MLKYKVSIICYEKPYQSVRKVILDCNGLAKMAPGARLGFYMARYENRPKFDQSFFRID